MWEKIQRIWKVKEIRDRIIYVLALLVIFRIAAHIPVPGVNAENLRILFQSNEVLGLFNIFSGGAFENFSIVMLGVGPYITASIVVQLLTMIVPKLEEMSKEGETGRKKISQYTRYLAVPFAIAQSYGTIVLLQRSGAGVIGDLALFQWVMMISSITAGTIFLMWLGELISEKGIGNGISLLIFAGIIAGVPATIQQSVVNFNPSEATNLLIFAAIGIVTIASVIFVTEGQRNIPVAYARQVRGGRSYGGVNSFLPLRVNQTGVIPIIFAISLVLFPSLIAQFFVGSGNETVANAATSVVSLFNNQLFYGIIYFLLVVIFTYFYTAVVFKPEQIAENLQKQGGFIPGIRPGKATEEYLQYVSNHILLAGALFLGIIAVLPFIVQALTNLPSLVVGGTSLLIVVSVVIETVKQIESQLLLRDYDQF